jgi:hypothetical protein
MALVKQEIPLNTSEQIKGYALTALLVVDELNVTTDERVALLPGLLQLAAAKQVTLQEASATGVLLGGPNHG